MEPSNNSRGTREGMSRRQEQELDNENYMDNEMIDAPRKKMMAVGVFGVLVALIVLLIVVQDEVTQIITSILIVLFVMAGIAFVGYLISRRKLVFHDPDAQQAQREAAADRRGPGRV